MFVGRGRVQGFPLHRLVDITLISAQRTSLSVYIDWEDLLVADFLSFCFSERKVR